MAKTSPATSSRGESKSPKQNSKPSPARKDARPSSSQKAESNANSEPAKPLAPPPRPGQQQNGNTPDYFANQVGGGSLSLEPNPFEQSFGAPPETPGGTKLPSVAALTSPSSLLPGGGATPFNWGGGSLRTGPLSPAMLSGPANDYFGDTHLRGGFPTPNESSLRTGLTPGGSGSMFPAPSPNSQALFAQLQSGGATPSTLDFHRTAMNAAAAKREQAAQQNGQQQQPTSQTSAPAPAVPPSVTSQPQDLPAVSSAPAQKLEGKVASGPFDQDNNAANSLYLLAQGRSSTQPQAQFAVPPPPATQVMPTQTAVPIPIPAPVAAASAIPLPTVPGRQSARQSLPPNGSPPMNGSSVVNGTSVATTNESGGSYRGSEDGSPVSDESEPARPSTRGKAKRNSAADTSATTNGRRKAQDAPAKNGPASKKVKSNSNASMQDIDMDDVSDDEDAKPGKDGNPKQKKMTEEEKRKNFLERNRVAALKCRQRKKQWLQNLQSKVELYSTENENLSAQISQLREEVVNLKTLLMAHKDCPVAQQQGLHGAFIQPPLEPYANGQLNPYGMAPPVASQPVIAGQVAARRFS